MDPRKVLVCIPILVLAVAVAPGQDLELAGLSEADPAESFVAANRSYDEANYPHAIQLYTDTRDAGVEDGRLYYNFGNAYLRNGELGRALASYRRGRVLRPRDQDLRANQNFARGTTKDAIEPPEPSALMSTLLFWYYPFSPIELALLVISINFLFWGIAIARIFWPGSEPLRWSMFFLLILLVATGGSLMAKSWLTPSVAVVLPQEIDVFTGPDIESVVRFKLHAGTELRVRDHRENWIRIALPDGQQGWIESQWADVVN